MQDLDLDIDIKKVATSNIDSFDPNNIVFGKHYTDHVFTVEFKEGQWQQPSITPLSSVQFGLPTIALHYGQSIFEGMKAFKRRESDEVVLMRPEENAKRLNVSGERMAIPELPTELFLGGLKKLLDIDRDWIPYIDQGSLYIRPFLFGTDQSVGVRSSDTFMFAIIMTPAGEYYPKPLSIKVEETYVRACEGGTGFAKAAGNYAASLMPAKQALKEGFDQILWTDAKEHKYIEESGTMNVFFVTKDEKFITPKAGSTVLKGITRDTIIKLLQKKGVEVEERDISVDEVCSGIESGTITEVFGAGTAVNVSYIHAITKGEITYKLPEENPIASEIKKELEQLRNGEKEDTEGWIVVV